MFGLSSSELLLWMTGLAVTLPLAVWLALQIAISISVSNALRNPYGRANAHTKILCRRCKYDLRASPDLCPECGTKPTRMQSTFIRYLMRIDKLDLLESKRKSRGER